MGALEIWGGLECTLNRIDDSFIDQCTKSGHHSRLSDLKLFSELKIKKLRYPYLWELVSPDKNNIRDWSQIDKKLDEIKRLGLKPIAGFLHHGSGPSYTNLLDPDFPEKFALYAKDFSERYPWIEEFTPINEILTTARFSCLYGHWYPHKKDDHSFLKAVFLQCKATVRAMQEIKKNIPNAKLIQTEDIGKCQSTKLLQYQCDFENERRWLSYDILCGNFNSRHPLYNFVLNAGISIDEINWALEFYYPPDVLGINHYILSNRFLDERLELYPENYHGGNHRHRYVDIGVVDTGAAELPTIKEVLHESWNRFKIPIAITEAHTRGYREDQMRWFYEIWQSAKEAKDEGVNVLAVTSWSLIGSYDWHSLCTTNDMFYEPGAFDLSSTTGIPKKTALAKLITELETKDYSSSPLLETNGYWRDSRRIQFAPMPGTHSLLTSKGKVLLIAGATGTLGKAFAKICRQRNISYKLLSRNEMDISILSSVKNAILKFAPWGIINAAGYVKVDRAEDEVQTCFRENIFGPTNLAMACKENNIPLLIYSSDLVFDGNQEDPYNENHPVSPLNTYGLSKVLCEEKVSALYPEALIIRSSAFFGPWDEYNFVTQTIRQFSNHQKVHVANDCRITPTYLPDLANASLDLLIDGEQGVFHLTNRGEISWADFARIIAKRVSISPSYIVEKPMHAIASAKRPKNSCLTTIKGLALPLLENALDRYFIQSKT